MDAINLIRTCRKAGAHILLSGPPGTGKTSAGLLAAGDGDAVVITASPDMSLIDLVYSVRPIDGRIEWQLGPVPQAMRDGRLLVVNEIDMMPSSLWGIIYSVMDDPRIARIVLPDGQTVRAAPGFAALLTTNQSAFQAVPDPVLDRIGVVADVSRPLPHVVADCASALAELAQSLGVRPGDGLGVAAGRLVGADTGADEPELKPVLRGLSPRRVRQVARLVAAGLSLADAGWWCTGDSSAAATLADALAASRVP